MNTLLGLQHLLSELQHLDTELQHRDHLTEFATPANLKGSIASSWLDQQCEMFMSVCDLMLNYGSISLFSSMSVMLLQTAALCLDIVWCHFVPFIVKYVV